MIVHTIEENLQEKFNWIKSSDQLPSSISINDLLDELGREQHLMFMMNYCGSPSKGHAASITCKRIGYLAAICIYAKHVHKVEASFLNGSFHTPDGNSKRTGWTPQYSFPFTTPTEDKNFSQWIAEDLYAKHLVPLVSLLGKEKGISRAALLENIFTYIKWVITVQIGDKELYQQLLVEPASNFGKLTRHPISQFECGEHDLRKTCCLYYQTEGVDNQCNKCPLIQKTS